MERITHDFIDYFDYSHADITKNTEILSSRFSRDLRETEQSA